MTKTILRKELKRLEELERVLLKHCIVCRESIKRKNQYKATNCYIKYSQTACSPSIQKRCKSIMYWEYKLTEVVGLAISNVQQELKE